MHSLLKMTAVSAAIGAALSLSPPSLVAQEATSDDAGAPGAAPDPAAFDEVLATDEAAADPTTSGEAAADDTLTAEEGVAPGGAAPEGTRPEIAAEEAPETEAGATTAAEGDSEATDADGNRVIVEGEDREGASIAEDVTRQNGIEPAADDAATADDGPEGETDESTETGEDEPDTRDRLATTIATAEEAAADVRDAAARLPAIVDRIDAIVVKVEGLPIEELVTELTSLASSANALVSSEATQALPADLSAALAEVEAILHEIREAGVIDNANATLQSTRAAADTLPGLVERAGVLLDQAGMTLEGFQASSGIVYQAEQALREVAAAADAVASLARAIERNPNSLIFGD